MATPRPALPSSGRVPRRWRSWFRARSAPDRRRSGRQGRSDRASGFRSRARQTGASVTFLAQRFSRTEEIMRRLLRVALVLGSLVLCNGLALGQARLGPYVVDANGLKVGHVLNEAS